MILTNSLTHPPTHSLTHPSLSTTTGTGLTHNSQPLQNNSIIVANKNNTFGNITCHSASRNVSTGQWTTPVTDTTEFLFKRRVNQSSFLSLGLQPSATLTPGREGVYQCAIFNEELGRLEYHSVWIYRNGYTGTEQVFIAWYCCLIKE